MGWRDPRLSDAALVLLLILGALLALAHLLQPLVWWGR